MTRIIAFLTTRGHMSAVLGRAREKRTKEKATVTEYPHLGHVTVDQAHRELSPSAFVFWLRIMGETEALKKGRRAACRLTRYSLRRAEELLLELARKRYITFVPLRVGSQRDAIVIQRRLVVGAGSGVIRLS
jgi:hypothetical protein